MPHIDSSIQKKTFRQLTKNNKNFKKQFKKSIYKDLREPASSSLSIGWQASSLVMISICSQFKQPFDMLSCQINTLDLVRLWNHADTDSNDDATTPRSNLFCLIWQSISEPLLAWNPQGWRRCKVMKYLADETTSDSCCKTYTYYYYHLATARTTACIPNSR